MPGVAPEGSLQARGIVDLVGFSLGDALFDGGDRSFVFLPSYRWLPVEKIIPILCGGWQLDNFRFLVESEPEQRQGRWFVSFEGRVEGGCCFVSDETGPIEMKPADGCFQLLQAGDYFFEAMSFDNLLRLLETKPLLESGIVNY